MLDQRCKPYVRNRRFYNHDQERLRYRYFHEMQFAFRMLGRTVARLNKHFFPEHITPEDWSTKTTFSERSNTPLITWIGHATFLIQINGVNILTDPIFGDISRFFKRYIYPTVTIEELPPIDIILISHNHWDHCDASTLKKLAQLHNPLLFVPLGDGALGKSLGFSSVTEMTWWEGRLVDTTSGLVRIMFLPANHWSGRGVFDINRSLWGSWFINANTSNIYFAGDTAYSDHFKEIGQNELSINVALMPIGPVLPGNHMKRSHVSADQAVQGFIDMEASYFIPMHWGTFQSGYDQFDDALTLLKESWKTRENELVGKTLQPLKFGEQWLYPH